MQFTLTLFFLLISESNGRENCLWQPVTQTVETAEQSAVLECTISDACPKAIPDFKWFVFQENNHYHLNFNSNPHKFSLDKGSLHINSLHVNDSGIYHCAAVWPGEPIQGKQYVGPGTTLIVRGKTFQREKLKVNHV